MTKKELDFGLLKSARGFQLKCNKCGKVSNKLIGGLCEKCSKSHETLNDIYKWTPFGVNQQP